MDILGFLSNAAIRETSATVILVLVVIMVLTGRLAPAARLREQQAETAAWRAAAEKSEEARHVQAQENYKLLESSRISTQFYRDFLPAVQQNAPVRRTPPPSKDEDDVAV